MSQEASKRKSVLSNRWVKSTAIGLVATGLIGGGVAWELGNGDSRLSTNICEVNTTTVFTVAGSLYS